uniref:Uncharacterized protein n=1 Tax=viral metagenome TaxID=1070528 RepID=A0A6C0KLQ2_9ZZZZ
MSSLIPAAAAAASTGATIAVMNPMDVLMSAVNTNPYFIGLMMLLLNLGGRFLALEITKEQEKFLSQPIVRRFFLFAVLFVATRNFVIAAGLAIIVIIILGYLFNENSELCLWRSCLVAPPKEGAKPQEGFSGLTPEEGMILKRLQDKQMSARQKEKREAKARENGIEGGQAEGEEGNEEKESEITASDIYNNAIQRLRMAFYTP